MDAGFVLALPFHHGDLEPDCVEVSTRGGGGLMRGIKIPLHDFALKMQGGLMREGGVFAGHYGNCMTFGSVGVMTSQSNHTRYENNDWDRENV